MTCRSAVKAKLELVDKNLPWHGIYICALFVVYSSLGSFVV